MSYISTELSSTWLRSPVIQCTLANEAGQSPPSVTNNPIEYIDGCLLNMALREKRIKVEIKDGFVEQESRCERQTSGLRSEIKKDMADMEVTLGNRFLEELHRSFSGFFDRVERVLEAQDDRSNARFNGVERSLRDGAAAHHNARAIFENGIINRLHHKIIPPQVPKLRTDGEVEWRSSSSMPDTVGEAYFLGQRAKGKFISDRDLELLAMKKDHNKSARDRAQGVIKTLCVYYDAEPRGEHLGEADGKEIWLKDDESVDLHMDAFLRKCGMRWPRVYEWGEVVRVHEREEASRKRSVSSQAGHEASDETGSDNKKRSRENSARLSQ
ncbi:hypothetical protein HO173_013246 [Letharia columbiana]|uniref:Uncharacterized protein n=1 Tax=Letharia columbiana TaxID=112416 RepID=A0A8H6CHA9_9LECA|nr:uncharacterized protein HO173_013246 [Letharia columbiana]KAF6223171.1 hypothetical protein HO173_013246 [Letharia columbiana]